MADAPGSAPPREIIPALAQLEAAARAAATDFQEMRSQSTGETSLIVAERNKLRGVLNSMTDGVFALDRAGRIILFNRAACDLTGRKIESVAGQLAEKVMPFRSNGELVMTRWLADHPGTEKRIGEWKGLELYREDGTSLFVDVQAVVLEADPNGISALVTFHDLTKTRDLEEMKVDFVSLAAHELRTPLTEVRGYLDIMEHEPLGLRKEGRKLLDQAVTSAARLSALVNNLLNVARIEHGELTIRKESQDLKTLLARLEQELRRRAEVQRRTLIIDIPDGLPPVSADTIGLGEVLTNLVANAITHTSQDGGTITISAHKRGNEVEMVVTDNGKGIPHDAQRNLFTKFYRVEGLKTTHGTGLGLFICRAIIEAHGGHIWVESEEGKGASFGFTLPISAQIAQEGGEGDNNGSTNITEQGHGWIKTKISS